MANVLLEGKYTSHSYNNKQSIPIGVIAEKLFHSFQHGGTLLGGYKVFNVNKVSGKPKHPLI